MSDKRVVKVHLMGKQWRTIPFEKLRKGDIFMLFDPPDMKPVINEGGYDTFKAVSNPFPDKDNPDVLGIETDVLIQGFDLKSEDYEVKF